MKTINHKYLYFVLILLFFTGCFSYYQKNIELNQAFEQKKYSQAEEILNNKKWEKKKRNILLYYLNKGTVLHMLGKYKESNEFFQKADFYIEDYQKQYGLKALSYLSNPNIVPYSGENYEKILLHYYSTLNYLMLNNFDDALVECKRMELTMENISTYYRNDRKLHRDAFTHLLLGIVYDAKKDYNNAFIAYRNAYEVYKNDYSSIIATQPPMQLKKDLLRTAHFSGFFDEVKNYEKEFELKYDTLNSDKNSLVCFWNNGMCPVKEDNSITFLITNMGNGFVVFTNFELGLSFPFYIGTNQNQINGLVKMKFFRVSFPKYVTRKPQYSKAIVWNDTVPYSIETAEDINSIAFQTLKDRMTKELGEMLLRMALKKLAEYEASQNSNELGILVNIANTITEKADTRNWQLLPYSINYTRVYLNPNNNIYINLIKVDGSSTRDSIKIDLKNRKTFFYCNNTPSSVF